MKRFIWVLTLALAALVNPAYAEFKWEHFGADPYATSREEAMKTREDAFRKLGFSEAVAASFMEATNSPGVKVRIVNDDRFDAMLSKGGVVHRDVVVAFKNPPKDDKMEFAAPAEKWEVSLSGTVYTLLLPEVCNNWTGIVPKLQKVVVRSLKPVAGSCPDVYTLKVNVWKRAAMNLPGVAQTHAKESLEEKFAGVQHVSRTHGKQFREANAKEGLWSTTAHSFRVSLIMTPEAQGGAPTITSEERVGEVTVVGMRELRFTRAQIEQWDAIRLIPTEDGNIVSPPRYHLSGGFHELRYFNHLPGTRRGEWDNNPIPDCLMNEHWIEQ